MKRILKRSSALILVIIMIFACLQGCGKKNKEKIDVYDIHTELQQKYLADNYDLYVLYAKGKEELSTPGAIKIEWADEGKCIFRLSEKEDMSGAVEYECEKYVELYNLKIATLYFYTVTSEKGQIVKEGKFMTADIAPRNMYVDSLTNIRDVGGWKGKDGKTIKQGMIYRSSKLTADETGEQLISDKGIDTMLNTLGIVTELDLRRTDTAEQGGISQSILGDKVKYISFPMQSSGNCLLLNKDLLPDLFKILADESNYPLVFHCSIGTDRTGVVAFLIDALLGVSEDDLYRDYLFSNFGHINVTRTNSAIKNYINTVNKSDGADLSEKTYNYLVSIGVDSNDIDTFINIMTK